MKHVLLVLALAASPAFADCPAPPDHEAELTRLFEAAQRAPDEASGQRLSNEMWQLWTDAPDARAQQLLDRGMARRQVYDFEGAIAIFDQLVVYCPDYAEGYNQRAFVYFLLQDFTLALENLDAALERQPRHVGALSGKALSLMGLGRGEAAQETLRAALALNPWIPERSLLQTPLEREL